MSPLNRKITKKRQKSTAGPKRKGVLRRKRSPLPKRTPKRVLRAKCLKLWREVVLKRYGSHCQNARIPSIRPDYCRLTPVDVDHIRGRRAAPWLIFEPRNGRPLCRPCHLKRTYGDSLADRITQILRPDDWEWLHFPRFATCPKRSLEETLLNLERELEELDKG